eukprot:scaffold13378_cov163-Cylindrotheca_fusiformis.AAC.1
MECVVFSNVHSSTEDLVVFPLASVVRSGRPPGESTQSTRHGRSPCADRVRAEKRQRRRRSSGGCA